MESQHGLRCAGRERRTPSGVPRTTGSAQRMQTYKLAACKLELFRHFPSHTTTVITGRLLQIAVNNNAW